MSMRPTQEQSAAGLVLVLWFLGMVFAMAAVDPTAFAILVAAGVWVMDR